MTIESETTSLRRLVGRIGLSVAIITTIAIPAGYFYVGYSNVASVLDSSAALHARYLSQYIYNHGKLWPYQNVRLAELLTQPDGDREDLLKRAYTSSGKLVVELGVHPQHPSVVRTANVTVGGETVGRFEIEASIFPLAAQTVGVAALSAALGFAMFFALRVFPMRVLDRTLGVLQSTNSRFRSALSSMSQGLIMLDRDGRLAVYNPRFLSMFGFSPATVHADMPVSTLLEEAVRQGMPAEQAEELAAEIRNARRVAEGEPHVYELGDGRVFSVRHSRAEGGALLTTFEDITEQRAAHTKIAHMARHDGLTNLPNRVFFHEQMERTLAHLGRNEHAAVICIDLDHFKDVNDTLGHPAGDALLVEVAGRLKSCVRESDTIARLGGDEFAILHVGSAPGKETAALATRMIDCLSKPYDLHGSQAVIGASIGVAVGPADGDNPDRLLRSADMALYRAKAEGRSTFRFFEAGMDARAQARRHLELDLRLAIVQSELRLEYQPIVDVERGDIVSFEALLRWQHPQRGLIAPLDFIPLAEETGLIIPIGEWVLTQACSDAAKWPAPIGVAVNLSPVQFRNHNLLQNVLTALQESGLPPSRLELEITESVLLNDAPSTLATLNSLRSVGVRISMDDFGTGYSSLSYLRSFPFDKIKIDGSFVRDMSSHDDSAAIVRAVTGLGKSLGITTTAEGVETAEQLEALQLQGCNQAQGFLFSKPRPVEDVAKLIRDHGKGSREGTRLRRAG
jgi:diguanylate cyclase (GGDEF)-like protein/PAS domain S-box-containing protein